MANVFYNGYKSNIGKIDWSDNAGTAIRLMLVTDTYTVDIDTHVNKSDIDALGVEVSGTAYTAGGEVVVNRSVTTDTVNDLSKHDADDITWPNSTITARGAILYLDTGAVGSSTLIAFFDFGLNKTSSASDFIIQWSANGVFRVV